MKLFNKQPKRSVDDAIDQILEAMENATPGTEHYTHLAEQLNQLKEANTKKKATFITGDSVLQTAGYLGGVLLIVNKENVGVVTSKALSLLPKIVK